MGRRQAPGWLLCGSSHQGLQWCPTAGECAMTWVITFQADPRTLLMLDDPPRQSTPTALKACSISLSAKPRALESVPWEAQICPSTEQLNLALAARRLQNMTVPIVHNPFLSVFGHFIDYLQHLQAFDTLILVSFTK